MAALRSSEKRYDRKEQLILQAHDALYKMAAGQESPTQMPHVSSKKGPLYLANFLAKQEMIGVPSLSNSNCMVFWLSNQFLLIMIFVLSNLLCLQAS